MDLQAAADHLGVHYQTAYRWVREGSLRAVKIGSAYEVLESEVERFLAARTKPVPPPQRTRVRDWEAQADRLHRLLLEGDELNARQLVDRLVDGSVEGIDLCERLFVPVLNRIGLEWRRGDVTVAEEHRASNICQRLLARMAQHPRGRPRGVAVVSTPPGEEHGLPAAMATIVLRADRWQVHHLGTEVPVDDLVKLVEDVDADLVVLSTTNIEAETALAATVDGLAQTRAQVLVGHPGDSLRTLLESARSARVSAN
jgi:excisionase family DNA binding protein